MKSTIGFGGCVAVFSILMLLSAGSVFAASTPQPESSNESVSAPEDSFLASDDYSDEDEIKGVFLTDAEYAKMTEDFSRNDVDEFDWGWAAADLDLGKYKTAHVVIKDDFGVMNPDFTSYVTGTFASLAKRLGLKVVDADTPANLVIGVDVIGYDPDQHFAFVTMIKPSIGLEMRVRDVKTGEDLYLARNTEHGDTPKAATSETAHDMLNMLR